MAFKMKGKPYKMGNHKTKATMAYMKSPLEQAKPDYPDIDGDGNTTESMKKAAADKKSPMEQKLSIGEKLSAAKDAITGMHPESNFGDIYRYYKTGKKNRRTEKRVANRKSKMNKK